MALDEKYPHLVDWIKDGWIEIGRSASGEAFARALDCGGLV
jgi:hypothetical protein